MLPEHPAEVAEIVKPPACSDVTDATPLAATQQQFATDRLQAANRDPLSNGCAGSSEEGVQVAD